MSTKLIHFYFDFSSPYGYFASTKIDEIAARHGFVVHWRPILLGVIFKITGSAPLPTIPLKGLYARHDFPRTARWFGVPFNFPSIFPISSVTPSRAFYWLQEQNPQHANIFAKLLYQALFVEDLDISNAESILAIAGKIGISKTAMEAGLSSPAIKERLRVEVDDAVANGVFGSPYFIVDGEPFHGSDRLEQLEKWLSTGGW